MNVAAQYAQAMQHLTAARTGQMLDTCLVTRGADRGQTPDLDAAGNVVETPDATVYEGPCTIADPSSGQRGLQGTPADQGGVPNARILRVPHVADLRPGDLLTVTASTASPGLAGDRFVVVGEEERSFATYRRYVLRGSSWLPVE